MPSSDSKAPVTNEQRAREWLALQGITGWTEGAKDYAISDLAALLASVRLEGAINAAEERTDCRSCGRD